MKLEFPAEVCRRAVESFRSEKCKSWEDVIVESCFLCALREINLHICVDGKKMKHWGNRVLVRAIGSRAPGFWGAIEPHIHIKLKP